MDRCARGIVACMLLGSFCFGLVDWKGVALFTILAIDIQLDDWLQFLKDQRARPTGKDREGA